MCPAQAQASQPRAMLLHLHWMLRKVQGTSTATALTTNLIQSEFPEKSTNFVSKRFYPTSLQRVLFFSFENTLPSGTDSRSQRLLMASFIHSAGMHAAGAPALP